MNSINWARVLAQVVYYFRAYLAVADEEALGRIAGKPFGQVAPQVKEASDTAIVFERGTFYEQDPRADRVLIAEEDGTLSHGFMVQGWSKEDNQLLVSIVDAEGRVQSTENRTSNDNYIAFKSSPLYGNPSVMGGWMADGGASPGGWLRTDLEQRDVHIQGNNVEAYTDRDGNNAPDGGGARVWDGNFQVYPQLGEDAASWSNQRAAVQSAFFHVNQIHDRLYKAGFTETAGNFQRDNHGRGGRAGDHVRVEVLDGGSQNNANFTTPISASTMSGEAPGTPRMQMYKWTHSTPHRPGSFDADIMWHEYAHGVIWRMVGDLDKPVAWAVNEGFADAVAIVGTNESRIGEWARNRSAGLRSADYRGYKRTLADYRAGKSNRYANAEIYAATMWRLKELFGANGRSDDQLLRFMIDGLNNTKPAPTFLDMRDGLLASGKDTDCMVWQAFAKFGMGEGARMDVSGSSVYVTPSDRAPSSCGGSAKTAPAPAPTSADSFSAEVTYVSGGSQVDWDGTWSAFMWFNLARNGVPLSGRRAVVDWQGLPQSVCTTDAKGWCTVRQGGLAPSRANAIGKIMTVDGKPVENTNGGPLTSEVPNPAPAGGGQSSQLVADLSPIGKGAYGSGGDWHAVVWFQLTDNWKPLAGKEATLSWGSKGETTCVTNSGGWCETRLWKLGWSDPSVSAEIVRIDGRAFQERSGKPKSVTVSRP